MTEDTKSAIYNLGRTFEAYKEANDQRLRDLNHKGHADPLTETKLGRLNDELNKFADMTVDTRKRMTQMEAAVGRQGRLNAGDEWKEAENFFLERKGTTQDIGIDAYRNYKTALRNYIRKNNAGNGVDEIKALSVGSDPDGGFAITPDLSGRITQLVRETSPVRQVANVVTIGTDALEGINDLNEATSGWVGETENRSETAAPKIGEYAADRWRVGV